MANILLMTHWTDGDVLPFIQIGKQMLLRGHKVTLFTHCYYKRKVINAGINFIALDTEEEYLELVEEMRQEIDPFRDKEGYTRFYEKYESIESKLLEYEKIIPFIGHEKTIIIAKNRSSTAAFLAAEKFGIPLINIFMNPVETHSILIFNEYFGHEVLPELNELRHIVGLKPVSSWLEFQSMAKTNVALWPDWYSNGITRWPQEIHYVGFMIGPLKKKVKFSKSIEKFLSSTESKMLITGGTSKMLHPEFYQTCASLCKKVNYSALLVTRYPELVPRPLPSNVVWVDEVSFRQIMPNVDIVVHHGGIGTVTNAIEAAVPQLILPFYVDRPFNASCVQRLGLGILAPPIDWSPEKLSKCVHNLQTVETKSKCFEYSEKIKQNTALLDIVNLTEEIIQKNT